MTKGIWLDTSKVKKIWWDTAKVKKVWYDTTLIWTASELVASIHSVGFNITATANPSIGTFNNLVDGNNATNCCWSGHPQTVFFNITDSYVEPLEVTIFSNSTDNNATQGVYVESVYGVKPDNTKVWLWGGVGIAKNQSYTFTRNQTDIEFKRLEFTFTKNGSTNLTVGEITFSKLIKYQI